MGFEWDLVGYVYIYIYMIVTLWEFVHQFVKWKIIVLNREIMELNSDVP